MSARDPNAPVPHIILTGDATARGLTHGRARRRDIEQAIRIYAEVFALPEDEVQRAAAHFVEVTRAFAPELVTEMDAIADGAGVPRHWIHALNARSELVARTQLHANECTAVFLAEHGLLGQTWDWLETLEPLIAVLDIQYDDGHRVLTLSEPGIVAKIGLSSAGLGVCLNFLRSPEPVDGVPVHVLLRALLDLRDPQGMDGLLERAGAGRSAHVLVGSATGEGVGLEFTGRTCHRLAPENGFIAHTNHFLREDFDAGPNAPNSHARLEQARVLAGRSNRDWSALHAILADCTDPEDPISVAYREMPGWDFGRMGTVCALAMDLRSGIMEVRRGPDPTTAWQLFDLQDNRPKLAAGDSFGTA